MFATRLRARPPVAQSGLSGERSLVQLWVKTRQTQSAHNASAFERIATKPPVAWAGCAWSPIRDQAPDEDDSELIRRNLEVRSFRRQQSQNSSSSRPKPVHLVRDAVGAQRVPIGRGVDRDDRLAEPQLGGGREPHHRQIGADLDDGVDVVAVELRSARRAALRGGHLGDPVQDWHCRAMSRTTAKPHVAEIALRPRSFIDRPVGRENGDALDAAVGLQCRRAGVRCRC